jgi:hypothetical protein
LIGRGREAAEPARSRIASALFSGRSAAGDPLRGGYGFRWYLLRRLDFSASKAVVCHFSLGARSQKAFEAAVEQSPKAHIRLRNHALMMQEHVPKGAA